MHIILETVLENIFNSFAARRHGFIALCRVTRTLLADILPARSAVRAVVRTAFRTVVRFAGRGDLIAFGGGVIGIAA